MSNVLLHQTVLRDEAVDALNINASGTYVDATFGRGGHTRLILERLGQSGNVLALDRDFLAIEAGKAINDSRLTLKQGDFGHLAERAKSAGFAEVDGILLDVGVSSPQLDDPKRGFSFRYDAPLDMRMDVTQTETAATFLATAEIKKITEVIRNYGEERFAFQIAKKIVAARIERPITTTGELAALVRQAVRTFEPGQNPATRTFQALRIHVNQELEQLALVLPQAMSMLRDGGRLVVISFHSLEDRLVKRFLREAASQGSLPKNLPVRFVDLPPPLCRLIGKPVRACAEEVARNPRARSAIMRVAEKLPPSGVPSHGAF